MAPELDVRSGGKAERDLDCKGDVESRGVRKLYPSMQEDPQLRWAFIRKCYSMLCMQLLLTAGLAAVVVFIRPIPEFLKHSKYGLAVFIVDIVLAVIILCALYFLRKRHPVNLILLTLYTMTMSLAIGMACAFTKGRLILMAAILTTTVVVGLTLYTFWAVKRGMDFSFMWPFLFASSLALLVFGLIQIFWPLGRVTHMVYSCLIAILFCAYIVYDTDNLIKRYDYDEYICATISLYIDVINLFLAMLGIMNGADG